MNLINIYIPPEGSVPTSYLPPLHLITQIPDPIIRGDFNGKSTAWYEYNITNTRGTYIEHELQHLSILNDLTEYTHSPTKPGAIYPHQT